MTVRLGGPGTPGYNPNRPKGPLETVLGGGTSLPFMRTRDPLISREPSDPQSLDVMLGIKVDGGASWAQVIRNSAGEYAVALEAADRQDVTPLDKHSTNPTEIMLGDTSVRISYDKMREELRVSPGAVRGIGEILLSFNP